MAPNYLNTDNTVIRAGVEQDATAKENAIISATLDFAGEETYIFDPTVYQQAGTFAGNVQALFLDNSTNPKPALVTVDQSGQQFPVPPYSTGWYQIVSNLNSKITIYSLGGSLNGSKSFAQFTNYPKEPVVYFGFSPLTDGARVKLIGVDDTTNMGITNPIIVGGSDGAVARTLLTDNTGRLIIVGSGSGGVAYGPDAPGVTPTQNPLLMAGVNVSNQVTRLRTDANGELQVDVIASALPTGAATETSLAKLTIAQGAALGTNTGTLKFGSVLTANPTYTTGTLQPLSLTTAGLLRTTVALQYTAASTTAGQSGNVMMGAVTTAAPSYTTAQTNFLSLTLTGALRVDGSGVTQPVSMAAAPPLNTSGTGTNTSPACAVTSFTVLAANAARKGAVINVEGSQTKILFGSTASSTVYSYDAPIGAVIQVPYNYTGIVTGISVAATGNLRVTELT